jgi:hypothetical protein
MMYYSMPSEEESRVSTFLSLYLIHTATLGGLVVSVLAMGPTGLSVAGSGLAKDGGFLWVIKIRSAHFLRWGSRAIGPMS